MPARLFSALVHLFIRFCFCLNLQVKFKWLLQCRNCLLLKDVHFKACNFCAFGNLLLLDSRRSTQQDIKFKRYNAPIKAIHHIFWQQTLYIITHYITLLYAIYNINFNTLHNHHHMYNRVVGLYLTILKVFFFYFWSNIIFLDYTLGP